MTQSPFLLASACLLAGLSVAALIAALFYPVLAGAPASARGRALRRLLDGAGQRNTETRSATRAQTIALRLVAEERRMKQMTRLSEKLVHAGLGWSSRRYAAYAACLGVCVFLAGVALRMPLGPSLSAAMLIAVVLPSGGLAFLARRRQQRFLAGLTGAVDIIVRGARSGVSLPDCLAMVANDAAPAVRREFAPVVAQLRAGAPLSSAIERLAARMPVPELRFFALVVTIQSQTGGNFTDALANLATVLRERERLAAKVRIASAEVKTSAITIGALPFIVIGATAVLAPEYIALLWQDERGRKLAVIAAFWMMAGIVVLRRMARIET
jgi:tight adherence protein B